MSKKIRFERSFDAEGWVMSGVRKKLDELDNQVLEEFDSFRVGKTILGIQWDRSLNDTTAKTWLELIYESQ